VKTIFTGNQDVAALIDALTARGLQVRGKSVQCPWHEDQSPSASLVEGSAGVWRVYCHVCDKAGDIYDITGQTPTAADSHNDDRTRRDTRMAPEPLPQPKRLESVSAVRASYADAEAVYEYTRPGTDHVDLIVVRYRRQDGKKGFSQWSPDGTGWANTAGPKPWPIYNRTAVTAATSVLVVEGEKCVHALRAVGIVATTSPCGAGKAAHADWSLLAGKTVYLWPDNDPADPKTQKRNGIDHMREVQGILERLNPAPALHWIDPDGLGLKAKGDVADLLEDLADADAETKRLAVLDVMADASPIGAAREVESLLHAMIAGTHKPIAWPWPQVSAAARALMPGTVTLLCGEAGSTKSFMLLEAAAYWHEHGIPVALFELEEDRRYHLHRALAQRARESRILDSAWAAENADEALDHYKKSVAFLNSFGTRIWEAPDKQVSLDELADWTRDRSKEGARIVAIDPVTAAAMNDKPWIADQKFIMSVKTIVRDFGNSLILVTHPTKTQAGKGKQMSGGAAYLRFSQAALWLSTKDGSPNRELTIIKARNGRGAGASIGYQFNGATLCFEEVGVIAGTKEAPQVRPPARRTISDTPSANEDLFA
jgi:KaiC/GvpD/RAD55 family RecA-like ATPase